jgi:hypothetical protein
MKLHIKPGYHGKPRVKIALGKKVWRRPVDHACVSIKIRTKPACHIALITIVRAG